MDDYKRLSIEKTYNQIIAHQTEEERDMREIYSE